MDLKLTIEIKKDSYRRILNTTTRKKIEDYFELKSIYHEEFNLEDSLTFKITFCGGTDTTA